jgi:hypothetical protein
MCADYRAGLGPDPAAKVSGHSLGSGHHLGEEAPAELTGSLLAFMAQPPRPRRASRASRRFAALHAGGHLIHLHLAGGHPLDETRFRAICAWATSIW